jgi:SAM-dependent MidA family methyltransferase
VAWITPSELFTPAYGAALGAFILQRHAETAAEEPLRILEVGGGNGTLARDILVRSSAEWVSGCRHIHVQQVSAVAPLSGYYTKRCSPVPSGRGLVGAIDVRTC